MTACEAARIELDIELCKNLERALAHYCQQLESMAWDDTGETRRHSSVLTCAISEALSLSQLWTPFEDLWGMENLRCLHSIAVNCKYYPQLMEKFRSILGIK